MQNEPIDAICCCRGSRRLRCGRSAAESAASLDVRECSTMFRNVQRTRKAQNELTVPKIAANSWPFQDKPQSRPISSRGGPRVECAIASSWSGASTHGQGSEEDEADRREAA